MDIAIIFWGIVLVVFFSFLYSREVQEVVRGRRKNFSCRRCGSCCRMKVMLYRDDVKRLSRAGLGRYLDGRFIKRINGNCPFLRIEKGKAECTIYNIRPEACKRFPRKKTFGFRTYDSRCMAFRV